MEKFLKHKIIYIYFSFQIIITFLFFESYFSYILIFNGGVLFSVCAYLENKKIESFFIILVMLLGLIYACLSLLYKNPNYYWNNGQVFEGYYLIKETKIRTRQMGSMTGRDSVIEPSSYNSLTLENKENKSTILVECSISELSCPFYNKIDQEVYIKYIESNFFSRKYAFYLKNNDIIYDEIYFNKKYKKENYLKIFFIVFYLGGCFFLTYKLIKNKNISLD